jgi:hypothetical protein
MHPLPHPGPHVVPGGSVGACNGATHQPNSSPLGSLLPPAAAPSCQALAAAGAICQSGVPFTVASRGRRPAQPRNCSTWRRGVSSSAVTKALGKGKEGWRGAVTLPPPPLLLLAEWLPPPPPPPAAEIVRSSRPVPATPPQSPRQRAVVTDDSPLVPAGACFAAVVSPSSS